MKCITTTALFVLVLGTGAAQAQAQQKASGMSAGVAGASWVYGMTKNVIMQTAEQVPQEMYSYKPTPEVRSLGAILGHIADSQKMFCAMAEGKQQPPEDGGSEKLTDKAQLIAKLKEGFAYCDVVYAKLTDADLAKPVSFFGSPSTVAGIITMNAAHNYEHYGNLVTYMRLNKMVPPSSQRQ